MAQPQTPSLQDFINGGRPWTVKLGDGTRVPGANATITISQRDETTVTVATTEDGATSVEYVWQPESRDLWCDEGSGSNEVVEVISMVKATYMEGGREVTYKALFGNSLIGDPEEGGVWGSETEGG